MRQNEKETKMKYLSKKGRGSDKDEGRNVKGRLGKGGGDHGEKKSRVDKIKESKRRRPWRRASRDRRQQRECCVSWLSLFTVTGTGGG